MLAFTRAGGRSTDGWGTARGPDRSASRCDTRIPGAHRSEGSDDLRRSDLKEQGVTSGSWWSSLTCWMTHHAELWFPDEVAALVLKAFATRVRSKATDVVDLWRCLEVALAAGVQPSDFVMRKRPERQPSLARCSTGVTAQVWKPSLLSNDFPQRLRTSGSRGCARSSLACSTPVDAVLPIRFAGQQPLSRLSAGTETVRRIAPSACPSRPHRYAHDEELADTASEARSVQLAVYRSLPPAAGRHRRRVVRGCTRRRPRRQVPVGTLIWVRRKR